MLYLLEFEDFWWLKTRKSPIHFQKVKQASKQKRKCQINPQPKDVEVEIHPSDHAPQISKIQENYPNGLPLKNRVNFMVFETYF